MSWFFSRKVAFPLKRGRKKNHSSTKDRIDPSKEGGENDEDTEEDLASEEDEGGIGIFCAEEDSL